MKTIKLLIIVSTVIVLLFMFATGTTPLEWNTETRTGCSIVIGIGMIITLITQIKAWN